MRGTVEHHMTSCDARQRQHCINLHALLQTWKQTIYIDLHVTKKNNKNRNEAKHGTHVIIQIQRKTLFVFPTVAEIDTSEGG